MGGKGKKKGGKKKGGKKKAAGEKDVVGKEEEKHIYWVEIGSLEQKLITEHEQADKAKAAEKELRNRVIQMEEDLEVEKKGKWDITCDMTRQYKSMQEELYAQISSLKEKKREQTQIIKERTEEAKTLEKQKMDELREKDEKISQLSKKMEEMSNYFVKMLEETLNKMKKKIDKANAELESENGSHMFKRIEEFNLAQK